jgi:hypothetical protein
LQLRKGWNLVAITRDDVNNVSIEQFAGNCQMEKIASWDSSLQKWNTGGIPNIEEGKVSGIAIKVSGVCKLLGGTAPVPALS